MVRRTAQAAAVLWAASSTAAFTTGAAGRRRPLALAARAAASSSSSSRVAPPPADVVPPLVESPVLARVYPALLAHREEYGHPNIPLGTPDGRRCRIVRRLQFQGRLSDREAAHLTSLGFRFHSFEDVYRECDFGEMLGKLLAYRDQAGTLQIPKKYPPDPELGAWVTVLRRLRKTGDLPQARVDRLDEVGFAWVSTRKCGSSFMAEYRKVLAHLADAAGDATDPLEPGMRKWIVAQRLAHEKGNLPDSRVQYMNDLPGIDWKDLDGARGP